MLLLLLHIYLLYAYMQKLCIFESGNIHMYVYQSTKVTHIKIPVIWILFFKYNIFIIFFFFQLNLARTQTAMDISLCKTCWLMLSPKLWGVFGVFNYGSWSEERGKDKVIYTYPCPCNTFLNVCLVGQAIQVETENNWAVPLALMAMPSQNITCWFDLWSSV